MERTPVNSSSIAEVGYDPATRTLEVLFHNGHIYRYFAVPPSVYDAFMASDSKGKFLNENLKGLYQYVKVP